MTIEWQKNKGVSKLIELMFKGQGMFQKVDRLGGCLKLFNMTSCVAHINLFTSKYYVIQWNSTNRSSS